MAKRIIRREGDEILRKKAREVTVFDERLHMLIDDMFETMYDADGAGLAAPQVGVLKRVVVIDVRDGSGKLELVNPRIIYRHGTQESAEACLSIPGRRGIVIRPKAVKVKALDRYGKEHIYDGEDFLATAFCHETDHLDGVLFIDKVERFVED